MSDEQQACKDALEERGFESTSARLAFRSGWIGCLEYQATQPDPVKDEALALLHNVWRGFLKGTTSGLAKDVGDFVARHPERRNV